MSHVLGLVLLSFFVTSIFMVPFIDILFVLKRKFEKRDKEKESPANFPIHNQLMKGDENTPSGGGVLLILVLTILSLLYFVISPLPDISSLKILLFTLLSFGALGFIDDIKWLITKRKGKILGLSR